MWVPTELCPTCWAPLGRSVHLSGHLCPPLCIRQIALGSTDLTRLKTNSCRRPRLEKKKKFHITTLRAKQEQNPWAPHKHCSNFPSFSEGPYFTFSSQNPWKEGRPGLGGILPAQTAGTSALAGFPEHSRLGIPRGTFRRLCLCR